MNIQFSMWLNEILREHDLSQADLARKSGLTTGGIAHLINHTRRPTPETCKAIANALKLSPEEVFRAAGLLPPISKQDSQDRKAQFLYSELNDDNKARALEFLEFLKGQESKGGKNAKTTPRSPQPKLS